MLFKISELGNRDIINIVDGLRLGPVKDMHINLETGMVESLVLRGGKRFFGLFGFGRDVIIPWQKIKKIGINAVLVECDSSSL